MQRAARLTAPFLWRVLLVVCAVLATSQAACSRSKSTGSSSAPTVRTDLIALRERMHLPSTGVRAARWVVVPRGIESFLGPTDYILFVYLELEPGAWSELDAAESDGGLKSVQLPAAIAQLLLGHDADGLPGDGTTKLVTGPLYDVSKFPKSPYLGNEGARFHDGLLMVFDTM